MSKKNENPLVSIITVCYNSEEYIRDTIESVLNQTYDNIEYIIVDGDSTDNTLDIIKDYEPKFNGRLRWVSEPDEGIYDAMNKGWKLAKKNSFILFLGAGDKILTLPNNLNDYSTNDIIYGRVYFDDDKFFNSKVDFRLKLGNTIHHQAILVHKNLHVSPPFNTKYEVYADFDFNQRLYKLNKINFIFEKSFRSYALPGGVSEKFNDSESLDIVEKNYGSFFKIVAYLYYKIQRFKNIIKAINF